MGVSTDAILAYGYDLGGPEEWLIEGAGEYGDIEFPWYDPDGDGDDFASAATRALLVASGFTESYEQASAAGDWLGYCAREREAEEALGVQIVTHCHIEYPMFLLATRKIKAYRGDVKDVTEITTGLDLARDAELLDAALHALGIQPKQTEPRWLLASYWS